LNLNHSRDESFYFFMFRSSFSPTLSQFYGRYYFFRFAFTDRQRQSLTILPRVQKVKRPLSTTSKQFQASPSIMNASSASSASVSTTTVEGSTVVFHGVPEVEPLPDKCKTNAYFPLAAERNVGIQKAGSKEVTVAVTIPCYNEEAESLQRTLMDLSNQKLSKHYRLEVVIVMDGEQKISTSMKEYLWELFDLSNELPSSDDGGDFFGHFDDDGINTVIIEPKSDCCHTLTFPWENKTDEKSKTKAEASMHLSLVVKKSNQKKVTICMSSR
jgi:Glycosyl transferase family 2